MTDTINKELLKESHNFLGTTVWIKEKPGGKFKYEVDLGRLYKTKLKGIYYDNKKVGRTKGFHTKVECIKYLKHLEELSKNVDTSISTDSKRDYINAREALDRAGKSDLTVTDAIKKWLEHQPKKQLYQDCSRMLGRVHGLQNNSSSDQEGYHKQFT